MRVLIFFLFIFFASPAHAVLKVDITRGHVNPMPIALPDLVAKDEQTSRLAKDIIKVVTDDLERSGLFDPVDQRAYIEKIKDADTIPNFADWRKINVQALVTGGIEPHAEEGKVSISFRLWDIFSEQQFSGKSFVTKRTNWRRVAHLIADEIYKRLTGEGGYFDSRIVYISEVQKGKHKIKRLAIMDADGANHMFLSSGKNLVMSPRFSPESQKLIYMAYNRKIPSVYLYDLETGREELLGNFHGMSYAPRFSDDGKKAIMSVSLNGNSEIYEMNLADRKKKRLTFDSSIDTSPSFSPDGRKIVFNSDRGGSQQIYVMDADGGNVERISFGKGTYGTPVWSPRGDYIAFTKMYNRKFHIGVMRTDGSGERMLTESWLDEGPTWSPNGRVIMFSRQTPGFGKKQGVTKLYSIDITGHNLRRMETPEQATDPAWSPLLR